MKIAAIDIGANSIHLVVSRLHAPGVREILDRSRELIQLGRSTFRDGQIPSYELTRAISVLKRYRNIAETHGVEAVLAVATSAVREARNRGEFVERAEKEARLAVRVLSGEEEGRLIYAGVRDGLSPDLKRIAVLDIGGGSAEVIVGSGSKVIAVKSLKLGGLRLANLFPGQRPRTLKSLEEHIRTQMRPVGREIVRARIDAAIGTSGTILILAGLLGVRDTGEPIRVAALKKLSDQLLHESSKNLKSLPGVGEKRADTIGPGSLVVKVFMEEAQVEELQPCERALREGVVADYASRNRSRLEFHDEEIVDPRRRSVYVMARRLGAFDLHAQQTAKLSLRLFDLLYSLHGLDARDRELLEYAALLHDAGYWIGAEKHHKHAYYLISNAPLEGFSHEEIEIIALAARYHRGSPPKSSHDPFKKLSSAARKRVCRLAAILRVADGLDRSHAGLVRDMDLEMRKRDVFIHLKSQGMLDLEMYASERRAELLEELLGRKVTFQNGGNGRS